MPVGRRARQDEREEHTRWSWSRRALRSRVTLMMSSDALTVEGGPTAGPDVLSLNTSFDGLDSSSTPSGTGDGGFGGPTCSIRASSLGRGQC